MILPFARTLTYRRADGDVLSIWGTRRCVQKEHGVTLGEDDVDDIFGLPRTMDGDGKDDEDDNDKEREDGDDDDDEAGMDETGPVKRPNPDRRLRAKVREGSRQSALWVDRVRTNSRPHASVVARGSAQPAVEWRR